MKSPFQLFEAMDRKHMNLHRRITLGHLNYWQKPGNQISAYTTMKATLEISRVLESRTEVALAKPIRNHTLAGEDSNSKGGSSIECKARRSMINLQT